jgi:hypothetical protein
VQSQPTQKENAVSVQDRINEVRVRAGVYVADNRVQIGGKLDAAERVANEQTKGRHQEKIAGARRKAEQLIMRLEQPHS